MELFKQTRLMGASTESIPPLAYEENFSNGKTHYYQSLLIGDEYMQDKGDRRGVRHLMRLEKEIMDDEGENKPRDFAKPVKAIDLPQDVPSTSDHRLIELENHVQCLMEAHLALTQTTQVNKVTASCEICISPHDTQYCMDYSEQAYVDYASSSMNEMGGMRFTSNQWPRNFNDAANTWKEKSNFNWARSQTFTSPQGRSISVHSSSHQLKLGKALLDFDSHQEKSTDSDTKEEVEELFDDETKEEEDEDAKYYNTPHATKELIYHEWLLNNPRPSLVKAKIRAENPSNFKISCMIGHFFKNDAYIDLKSPINIMSRNQYNQIMTYTTSVIDDYLGEFVFGKPFIDESGLVYNKEEGTVMFKQDNEKIKFKMPHTMELFKQTRLTGASTDSIPPLAYEENFSNRKTHYYQSLLIMDEYRQDKGDRRGFRHLMRLEKEIMDDEGEVT
ncbi:hypothetical protein Tco_0186336 [Tanacetum coccineum]